MTELITTDLVTLGADWGSDKHDVIRALAAVVDGAGRAVDRDQLIEDAFAREATSATGLPGGIAIPHCRTTGVEVPTLAFARLEPGVDFGAKDGAADLAFLIAAPAGGDADHLTILTKLARALVKPAFTNALREAETDQDVVDLVAAELGEPAAAPAKAAAAAGAAAPPAVQAVAASPVSSGKASIVAVTACPTGIAHTYMAAEALEAAAERAGVELHVETQGSAGAKPLAPETIANAAAVIFAVDVGVRDRSRFAGKPMVSSGVKRPIDDADAMIAEALRYAEDPSSAPRVEGTASEAGVSSTGQESFGAKTRRVLMTGVSYMIPFVAAGGLLIALSFLLGGYEIVGPYGDIAVSHTLFDLPDPADYGLEHALFDSGLMAYIGALFFIIGKTAFALFIPAFAGYIAYAIADRPGIAPGFVMGGLAANLFGVETSGDNPVQFPATGFLGAIVGG
ncbi:MAG TPA: fructose PTS transporter subunit IIB, partial [Ornithinibacter sp.]|nr:fructose PTS transporter subunit IIB [Ornithinibacter sp.]